VLYFAGNINLAAERNHVVGRLTLFIIQYDRQHAAYTLAARPQNPAE
jgi:hypothetical protein